MTDQQHPARPWQAVVPGAELSATITGSGPPTVYAHGLSASRAVDQRLGWLDWSPVVDTGRTLLAYDARGHGRSTGSTTPADYRWSALAGDLLTLLDAWDQPGPVSAIGSSMGTGTLLHAVLQAPARFDRLVLTAPPTAWETRAAQTEVYRTMAEMVETSGPEVFAQLAGQAPVPPVFADLANYPPTPDIAAELMPTVFRGAALADLPDPEALRTVDQPVLVLAWAEDPGHPVSTAQRLLELIPDARLEVAHTPADLRGWGAAAAAFLDPSRP